MAQIVKLGISLFENAMSEPTLPRFVEDALLKQWPYEEHVHGRARAIAVLREVLGRFGLDANDWSEAEMRDFGQLLAWARGGEK